MKRGSSPQARSRAAVASPMQAQAVPCRSSSSFSAAENMQLTPEKLELARELEDGIDAFRKDLKKVARKRLEGGADVKAELLYIDIVRTIEHIGDNCFNISEILTNG